MKYLLFFSLFSITSSLAYSQENESLDTAFIPPQVISAPPALYPRRAVQNGQEGWVLLSFVVNTEGEVESLMVENSSNLSVFGDSALNAVQNFMFTPAMENGQAVEASFVQYLINFSLEDGSDGARSSFLRRYEEISQLIRQEKFEGVEELINDLLINGTVNNYENAWINWLNYQYLESLPDSPVDKKIEHLLKATALYRLDLSNGNLHASYLPDDLYFYAVLQSLILLTEKNYFTKAREIIDLFFQNSEIRDHADYIQYADTMNVIARRISTIVQSDQPIGIRGSISENGYWVHWFSRSSFSIDNSTGKFDVVDIRCRNGRRHVFDFSEGFMFLIPEDWGQCWLYLKGEPNAIVDLYEFNRQDGL